ncbi:MAG: hypothetical protein KC468_23440 [Myxococcales bacterium]|nr:hypothetical protein [Myxococcales bacterium]
MRTLRGPRARGLVFTSIGALALLAAGPARAGTITAFGNVTALNDIGQMNNITGTANFDGLAGNSVPLNQYAAEGLTFHTGLLTAILNGVTTGGSASQAFYINTTHFPLPIAGGGSQDNTHNRYAGVATFSEPVTQFGLTASKNGTQWITAWDDNGAMIGSVRWVPANDAAFVGLDAQGVNIKMIAYGNDDLWNGASYGIGGSTIYSDNWVWGIAEFCGDAQINGDEECDDGNDVDDTVAAIKTALAA